MTSLDHQRRGDGVHGGVSIANGREREEGEEFWGRGPLEGDPNSPGDSEFASTWFISELDMVAVLEESRHAASRKRSLRQASRRRRSRKGARVDK